MASGTNEVKTDVDAQVDSIVATGLLLLQHIRLVLVVEELNDGLPRVSIVDIISESRRVDDSEANLRRSALWWISTLRGVCTFEKPLF